MPPQIAALPRNHADIPVTFTAAWTSELHVEIRPDPLLQPIMGDALAYFSSGAQGDGEPRIVLPHPERVRRCVIEGLCQVCGQPLAAGPRWVCDIRLGEEWFRVGKRLVPLLIDAWTCISCLDYSIRNCPNLSSRKHLNVLRVYEWLPVPTLERPKWIPDDIPYGPIGFVKIAALDYATFSTNPAALGAS